MAIPITLVCDAIGCVVIFLGLLVNIFVTVVNLTEWWVSRKLKPYDKIMVNVGLSRIFLLFCFIFRIVNRTFKLNLYPRPAHRRVFRTAQLLFDFASLWFAMWLCFLYFVKVTIFQNRFLLRVKLRLPQLIPPMVTMTYGISFVFGFIFSYFVKETSDVMDNVHFPANKSLYVELTYMVPVYFFGNLLPFVLVSISTALLIRTIAVHIRHVKAHMTGSTKPRLDAHLAAIRSAALVEAVTVCNLLATVIFRFDFYGRLESKVSFLFLVSYPFLHTLAIVAGNVKLKGALWRVIGCREKTEVQMSPNNRQMGSAR